MAHSHSTPIASTPQPASQWRGWILALAAYLVLYAALLAVMHAREGFGLEEPLFVLGILGFVFTGLAWVSTWWATPREIPVKDPARETLLVLAYLVFLAGFITFGFPVVRGLAPAEPFQTAAMVTTKLVVFVLVPFLALRAMFGYRVHDFVDLRAGLRGHWITLIVVGIAIVAFQLVVGRARRDLGALGAGPLEIGAGALIALVLSTIEAGVVEEYFFRALLLERLAARLRSPGPALVITSLLFGLAHAPGLYLRPEITMESLTEPSLLMAVGYSVVITSVAGFMFGVLWLRTRNLLLVALLHGLNDCVPATAEAVSWLRALS